MNRLILNITGFLLILTCLFACGKDKDAPVFDFDISNEFHANLWEELDPSANSHHLVVRTLEKQACTETQINYQFNAESNELSINIDDFIVPNDCIIDSSYVETMIDLGNLENGTYKLNLTLQNEVINKGNLVIDPVRMSVFMSTTHGISFERNELLRVPEYTIWGFVSFRDANMAAIKDQFINDLLEISDNKLYRKGHYGYFTIDDNNAIQQSINSDFTNVYPLIYHLTGEEAALKELIQRYRDEYPSADLDFRITTYKGEEL